MSNSYSDGVRGKCTRDIFRRVGWPKEMALGLLCLNRTKQGASTVTMAATFEQDKQ